MKKLILLFAVLVSGLLVVSSCGKTGAPNCADEDVKSLVIQIAEGELKRQLLIGSGMLMDVPLNKINYDEMNKAKDQNEKYARAIAYVDERMAKVEMGLSGIRTEGKDDEIRKCNCSGELSVNGKSGPVEYTAQYTEDGQIYIEVFGL